MKFLLATSNKNKIKEIRRMLSCFNDVEIITLSDINADFDVEETGSTFEENARLKALAGMKISNLPCIADDSGLMVDALNGEPGVYSARYAGVGATNIQRIEKLLKNLENVPEPKRTAKFVCAICCVFPDGREIIAKGECNGKIGYELKGDYDFGYNPVFVSKSGKTFAELNDKERDEISHRNAALKQFISKLKVFKENLNVN